MKIFNVTKGAVFESVKRRVENKTENELLVASCLVYLSCGLHNKVGALDSMSTRYATKKDKKGKELNLLTFLIEALLPLILQSVSTFLSISEALFKKIFSVFLQAGADRVHFGS